ncbi:MAG TPA: hypothetical protein VL282_15050 [Tepidisphaeraceae bacterium]|jgi:hypothetical protein|nr:hypothetical protein [Tepidisphaeraceae bacterium]
MWEQYRRTFLGMQMVIAMVTIVVFIGFHSLMQAMVFFAFMQLSAVIGALWAARLKAFITRRQTRLPLQ